MPLRRLRSRLAWASLLLAGAGGGAALTTSAAPAPAPQKVAWASDIAPIIVQNCASCHYPNGPAPFSLLDYPHVQAHALQIAQVTASHYMPPWLPDHMGVPLAHTRGLTDAQIALFWQWNAAGAPEGNPSQAPSPPKVRTGWALGTPDQIVTMPQAYTLPPETTSPYRCFVLPLSLPQVRRLRAVQFLPGNAAVVRHAVLFADPTGTAQKQQADSGAVGYTAADAGLGPHAVHLADWAVGSPPWALPPGKSETLPAHSDLVLLERFETDGQPEPVQSQICLYFAPQTPTVSAQTLTLGSPDLIALPGQTGAVTASATLPAATQLWRITPEGDPICRTLTLTAQPPHGPSRTLLHIPDWNSDWQDSYEPASPLILPAGTRLSIRWTLDNTPSNPRNPSSPPMTAQTGLDYLQEMATVHLTLFPQTLGDASVLRKLTQATLPPATVQLTTPDRHG